MMLKLSPTNDDEELRAGIENDHELSEDETPDRLPKENAIQKSISVPLHSTSENNLLSSAKPT